MDVIKEIASGQSAQAIDANRILRGAFERNFEIVAEASKNLDAEFKQAHPELPWRKMVDLGNLLRHEYAKVEIDILYTIARDDLPVLEQVCKTGLERRPENDAGSTILRAHGQGQERETKD